MNDFCEYKAFFDEGLSFYKGVQIVQESSFRVENDYMSPELRNVFHENLDETC